MPTKLRHSIQLEWLWAALVCTVKWSGWRVATKATTLASNWTSEMWIRTRCAHNIQFKFNVMVIHPSAKHPSVQAFIQPASQPDPDSNQVIGIIVIAPSVATSRAHIFPPLLLHAAAPASPCPVQSNLLFNYHICMHIISPLWCTSHALCAIQMWYTKCVGNRSRESRINRSATLSGHPVSQST